MQSVPNFNHAFKLWNARPLSNHKILEMSNLIFKLLLMLFLVSSCDSAKRKQKNFIGQQFVPEKIKWELPGFNEGDHVDKYAHFRTIYFSNDSTVFFFDSVNGKPLICRDSATGVIDKETMREISEIACNYQDSILFGVENVEMYKGIYKIQQGDSLTCMLENVADKNIRIYDTLKLIKSDSHFKIVSKENIFRATKNFNKEGLRRFYENINL